MQRFLSVSTIVLGLLAATASSQAGVVDQYTFDRTVPLPADPLGLGRAIDARPDGRLVVAIGLDVWIETAKGSDTFALQGTLPGTPPAFGPAFLRVSPDGTRLAYGDNGGHVGIFDAATLTGSSYAVGHSDATWLDDQTLAVTDFGVVTLLDTTSANPMSPVNPVVIAGVGGASGGIAFDAAGRLFTGNGFQTSGPSATGDVKAFASTAWQGALATGVPLDFESAGTMIGNVLSASSLSFDSRGNLIVGGGDLFGGGDSGYAAVVSAGAIAGALGGTEVDPDDAVRALQLDPSALADSFYAVRLNHATGELVLSEFGVDAVAVYRAATHSGSGEDFTLAAAVSGAATSFPDVHAIAANDSFELSIHSPFGGTVGAVPFILGQLFVTGTPPATVPGLPELQVDPSPFVAPVLVLARPVLGPVADTLTFTAPAVPPGLSAMIQAIALTPLAANGLFTASNGHEFRF